MVLLIGLAGCSRSSHNADVVIEKYFTATGGRERLAAIHDVRQTGDIVLRHIVSGQERPVERRGKFVLIFKRPDKMRSEIAMGAMSQVTMFDGKHGWSATMTTNATQVAVIEGDALKQLRLDAIDSNDQLLTYKQRGLTAALLGESSIPVLGNERDRRECIGVELTGPGQPVRQVFFDKQTGLILKSVRNNSEVYLGDFQPVEGIMTTMHMLARKDQNEIEFRIAEVKFNTGVDDAVFRPQPKK